MQTRLRIFLFLSLCSDCSVWVCIKRLGIVDFTKFRIFGNQHKCTREVTFQLRVMVDGWRTWGWTWAWRVNGRIGCSFGVHICVGNYWRWHVYISTTLTSAQPWTEKIRTLCWWHYSLGLFWFQSKKVFLNFFQWIFQFNLIKFFFHLFHSTQAGYKIKSDRFNFQSFHFNGSFWTDCVTKKD